MPAPENPAETPQPPPLSPLEGGRWRPVRPEELIRRTPDPAPEMESPAGPAAPAKAPLERRQELERYLRDRPADIDAYLELAAIYRDSQRTIEATRVLKSALELEPDHPEVLWQLEEASLARALRQLREVREVAARLSTPEAQRELERAQVDWACRRADVCRARLGRHPEDDHLRVVLAEALRDLDQIEEAIEVLGPALRSDAHGPLAYLILGHCKYALGADLEALSAWRQASMRRAVPAPARIRVTALRAACDMAERQSLRATLGIYQQALRQAEADLQREQDAAESRASHAHSAAHAQSSTSHTAPARRNPRTPAPPPSQPPEPSP